MRLNNILSAINGCIEVGDMEDKIRKFFKANKLPKPGVIKLIGKWARGNCYAVTCGLVRLKKYCVYCINDEIYSVRLRG